MKTLSTAAIHSVAQGDNTEAIQKVFSDYQQSAGDAVFKAILCGNLMNEQRQYMNPCQSGKGWFSPNKRDDQKFRLWIKENCPAISERTAYRFMEVADKVLSHLRIVPRDNTPVSALLQQDDSQERYSLQFYISGKTMRDCLAGVIVETDETHRLIRAQNGKQNGGTHELDKRDNYAHFLLLKLRQMTSLLTVRCHKSPRYHRAIRARDRDILARGFVKAMSAWPKWLLEEIQQGAADELKKPDEERTVPNGMLTFEGHELLFPKYQEPSVEEPQTHENETDNLHATSHSKSEKPPS